MFIWQTSCYSSTHNISKTRPCIITFIWIFIPEILDEVFKPIYWSFINIQIDDNIFEVCEIVELAKFLEKSLKHLNIALFNDRPENDSYLDEIFSACSNLRELYFRGVQLYSGIDKICSKLKSLTHLELKSKQITSDHLIQITNNLKYLKSFFVTSSRNIDDGLIYFLKNVSRLQKFGMNVPSSNER